MNRAIRHWKQRFDANKTLVLLKNLTFAGVEMKAGDLVTDEMRAKLGPYKLKMWWESGTVGIKDHVPAKPEVMAAAPEKAPAKKKAKKKLFSKPEPKPEPKPEQPED